jgi:hypothetical protein
MNGTYEMRWGLMYSSTFTAQSGDSYNRQANITNARGTTVTQTVEGHLGRYPWVDLWDNRITKRFKIGDRNAFEASGDLYNTANVNTVTSIGTNSSSSSYLKPTAIISPRIFKPGLKWKFMFPLRSGTIQSGAGAMSASVRRQFQIPERRILNSDTLGEQPTDFRGKSKSEAGAVSSRFALNNVICPMTDRGFTFVL